MTRRINGAKLRALREAKGWTQEVLAERTGLSPRSIQRGEHSSPLALASLAKLTAVFQVTPVHFDATIEKTAIILRTIPVTVLVDINDSVAYYRKMGAEIVETGTPECTGIKFADVP